MALVTGLTAERMLEIEAASVVSGEIDGDGHLILERHDGTDIDAGYALVAVPDASTAQKGVIRLATQAETEALTATNRAVTPASLESTISGIDADIVALGAEFDALIVATDSISEAASITSYPIGTSMMAVTTGWSIGGSQGLIITHRNSTGDRHVQFFHLATANDMWKRTFYSTAWIAWSKLAMPADPSTMGITGEVKIWAGSSAPSGWQLCDGTAISRSIYSALFTAIGTTYGVGNGTTTFNVPNTKGKTVVGYDSSQTEFDALGETGGAKTVTLTSAEMPSHTHVQNAHGHTLPGNGALTDGTGSPNYNVSGTTTTYGFKANQVASTTAVNQTAGSGGAHNNLQPYLVMNHIIKL